MTTLSPAAQAVLDAFTEDNSVHDWKHNHYNTEALAAALRAAADQLQKRKPRPSIGIDWSSSELYAIAAELSNF